MSRQSWSEDFRGSYFCCFKEDGSCYNARHRSRIVRALSEHCSNIVRTRGVTSVAKGELMRKHLMAVLSVLGLAGSSMPAQAQQDAKDKSKDAKTESQQKIKKQAQENKAATKQSTIKISNAPNLKVEKEYKEQKAAEEQNAIKAAKEYKEQKAAAGEAAHKGTLNIQKLEKSDAEKKAIKSAAENKAAKQVDKATPK